MRRREFITFLGGAAAAVWPHWVMAQQPKRVRRIGVLMELAADDPQARANVAAFQRGLHTLGWLEGSNLTVDYRWAPDDAVLVWKFAKELVQVRPELIVAGSSPVLATLLGETRSIPIVFVSISDPIGEGFVASFAHPGGNVTGFTNFESSMTGKWVELLTQIASRALPSCSIRRQRPAVGRISCMLSTPLFRLLKCELLWRWFMTAMRSKRLLQLSHASPVLVRFCYPTSSRPLITKWSSIWQRAIVYPLFIPTGSWWNAVA